MGPLRRRGISGRDAIVVTLVLAAVAAALLAWPSGSSPTGNANGGRFASQRFGLSGFLPPGWSRSPRRLVPLLMPREVLSVGTAPMPPGGGGNCHREPVAAIARMRQGDALVSVQEYTVIPRMHRRLSSLFPPLASYASPEGLRLQRSSHGYPYRWATLPFRSHGRAFDALVYVKGDPSPARLAEIVAILAGLDVRPDAAARPPSAARVYGTETGAQASTSKVTGPSLTRATFMSAPKTPRLAPRRSQNRS